MMLPGSKWCTDGQKYCDQDVTVRKANLGHLLNFFLVALLEFLYEAILFGFFLKQK